MELSEDIFRSDVVSPFVDCVEERCTFTFEVTDDAHTDNQPIESLLSELMPCKEHSLSGFLAGDLLVLYAKGECSQTLTDELFLVEQICSLIHPSFSFRNSDLHLQASEGFRDKSLEDSCPSDALEASRVKAVEAQRADC